MPAFRFSLFGALGISLGLLAADVAWAQPGGRDRGGSSDRGDRGGDRGSSRGGDRGGDRGGSSRGSFGGGDPSQRARMIADFMFSRFSGGSDVLDITQVESSRDPTIQDRLRDFMARQGISGTRLTRDQFSKFIEDRMSSATSGRGGSGGSDPRSGDSREGRPTLDPSWIQPEEPEPEPEKRPMVYTSQTLPKELQNNWFAQLDRDKDGQVALFEWKQQGRSISDFRKVDVNNDGFATAEEALRAAGITPGAEPKEEDRTARGDSRGDSSRNGSNRGDSGRGGDSGSDWRSRFLRGDRGGDSRGGSSRGGSTGDSSGRPAWGGFPGGGRGFPGGGRGFPGGGTGGFGRGGSTGDSNGTSSTGGRRRGR